MAKHSIHACITTILLLWWYNSKTHDHLVAMVTHNSHKHGHLVQSYGNTQFTNICMAVIVAMVTCDNTQTHARPSFLWWHVRCISQGNISPNSWEHTYINRKFINVKLNKTFFFKWWLNLREKMLTSFLLWHEMMKSLSTPSSSPSSPHHSHPPPLSWC